MQEFIQSILELSKTDMKRAKSDLAEYAEFNHGIKLKKTKSLENMIIDLESELPKEEADEIVEDEIETKLEQVENENERENIRPEVIVENIPVKNEVVIKEPVIEVEKPKLEDIHVFVGYLTVPYWIADWIVQTEDWKSKKCPWNGSQKFINTIKYFIDKDGQIEIRETRNSKFVTLK